ncbi:hypothetical protein [Porcipelethomonas sp.]|uniref:hypothetical protein n=1 Tax=Porcipelethomonas sp. TaxID=2981675 RepID=UPI0030776EEE
MRKMKSRVISLLTMTAIIATGTVPQVFAEALDDSTSAVISEAVNNEQKTENEPTYITGEIEDLRTRYSKTYEQSDGSMISLTSRCP